MRNLSITPPPDWCRIMDSAAERFGQTWRTA